MISQFFVDIVLKRFIIRFLGIRTRYIVLNLIGQKVTLNDLKGKENDVASQAVQDIYNAFIGALALFLGFIIIGYLFFR